ncbi:peptide/nickel transport system permease protein [Evansella vedderi]|uniref:Peptide/nickel transport system permease protein n=1 Tax=Evansella vedderi TaxID=38282 RepID=A0ABT9ZYU9_9BACI|nr:ABC transporter permease [Evansella vedderi]MDQ0256429.1 peptide/nickel transport system permease protein [Evansella vedderi]
MTYIIKKLFQIIPVLFIISFVVFIFVNVSGDPVVLMLPEDASNEEIKAMQESLGLDKPVIVQYGLFLSNVMKGQFGQSFVYKQEALPIVLERLPATFELMIAAIIISILISIPLGVLSAIKRNTFIDLFISGTSVLGKAMPNFWLGLMLMLVFSVYLQILPVSSRGSLLHLVLPAITTGTAMAAELTRMLRSQMLDVLHQDYMRTARSKGLSHFSVVYKHGLRNSLLPVITLIALNISTLVGGALVTEVVFAWPGIGQLVISAVHARDMAVVQACIFVIAIFVIGANFLADILYRVVDPRIKYR